VHIGNILKGGLVSGMIFGTGALLVGSAIVSVGGTILRPFARATIKRGLNVYGWSKDVLSEAKRKSAHHDEARSRSENAMEKRQHESSVPADTLAAESPDTGRSRPWIVRGW
jgi:hypothetical protein